ncbi:dolichyl-P-Man:Man(7)GlcNAc(2)-PP-dolichol alpha-1,6-mannosyltransferase [Ascosphaera aggregata]|nr:dolichyl-P-Man:Man(7)GlcNAc(2)-PP-dolichol alpha-1,6-mannosyltransferase [Ascosphaera aggregata]
MLASSILYWSLAGLLLLLIQFHLFLAPYTKVEESFNIQAAHDFYKYGVPTMSTADPSAFIRAHFDHLTFPGAVPRTLLGALVISKIAQLIDPSCDGLSGQLLGNANLVAVSSRESIFAYLYLIHIVRSILGLINGSALIFYGWGLMKSYGKGVAIWYLIFILSQFHIVFYASRPLPNMFAFAFTTVGSKFFLPSSHWKFEQAVRDKTGIILLTVAGVIFRSEIAILLAMISLSILARGRLSIWRIISSGILGAALALSLTVPFDSFFWQRLLWPELTGFIYNIINGQASSWGTSFWHHYFTNSLPKLLLNPLIYLLCIPCAVARRRTRLNSFFLLTPSLAFIAIYSFQPHKEWRFIVYTIPPICGAAGMGASHLWSHRRTGIAWFLLLIALVGSVVACFMISTFVFLPVSMVNYPGGVALATLQKKLAASSSDVAVWMDTYTCQTGVTRWLEVEHPSWAFPNVTWTYDRTEDEEMKRELPFWEKFNYVIVERALSDQVPGNWEVWEEISAFNRVKLVHQVSSTPGIDKVETTVFSAIFGEKGATVWRAISSLGQLALRGYWVEIEMVPRIEILRRREEDHERIGN